MNDGSVTIGEAAATVGVAVSTLRWWERHGLLDPGREPAGRRRYDEADLRRIGLIDLFRRTGMLTLDDIASLLAGRPGGSDWRETLRERADAIDRRVAELRAARRYLDHLLLCRADDVTQCPYTDQEIREHTAGRTGCRSCGARLPHPPTGRPRSYCSAACRQRAYRTRR